MATIRVRRGQSAQSSSLTLVAGEPAFTLDTKKLYIGDGVGKALINPDIINLLNSSDILSPLSAAMGKKLQDEKAPLASPVFTGTPTAPTPATNDDSLRLATTAFVKAAITALVNSSPAALDTLQELATALGNDPNFATTMTNALAAKAPLASPALTGTPTTTTPATTDNSSRIANTAYVRSYVASLGVLSQDGDVDGGAF